VDGTFASFHRAGSVSTGSVWDAIAAGLLALPPARRRRVLVLGLGAGSVARLVRALAPRAQIVGVEFDPEIIEVSRKYFGLDGLDLDVQIGDAYAYLKHSRRRFDAILEDVFVGSGDAVQKPEWLPQPGHLLAARCLAPGGVLVSNALDEASFVSWSLRSLFPSVVQIEVEDYDNRVFVGGGDGPSGRNLRSRVAADPVLRGTLPLLSFRSLGGARGPAQREIRPRP